MNYLIVMPILTEIFDQSYTFPLGIAYVSASLKQTGRNVITYNLNYKSGTIKENLEKVIREEQVDVIATGGLTAQYWQLERILTAAREVKPDVVTWVGGGIITSAPEAAMEALAIADYGMVGEGEATICELAEVAEGLRDPHSVKGLVFRENGAWVVTEPRPELMDLDALPFPDYEGFSFGELLDKKPTDIYALNQGRFGMVSFGRSCPFNCTFCFHPSGTKYRKRSIDSVFEEIDYLIEHYHIKNIAVTDELFVRKMEDAKEFCRRITQRGIGYVISLRVDMVNREMLTLLRDSGCLSIGFGLESADNSILASMKKHITVEQIDDAMGLCCELGLNCMGNFIFGDQNETYETAMNTINWWKNHPQYRIAMHMIILYPGSELYRIAVARGIIQDQVAFIKNGCPITNVSKMSQDEYRSVELMTSVLNQGRTERLRDASVVYTGFGKAGLSAGCPACGAQNTWREQDVFRSLSNVVCAHCGTVINAIPCDYVGTLAEENFQLLRGRKTAIWPMTSAVTEFLDITPSAWREDVVLIDSSKNKQGALYRGKRICPPAVIDEENIGVVFISVTTSVATEIIDALKTKHPSVKHILFLGDIISENFKEMIE